MTLVIGTLFLPETKDLDIRAQCAHQYFDCTRFRFAKTRT